MLNLWRNKPMLLPILALLLGTQSCFNENDFDTTRIAGLKASPSIAIPLLHGSLSMEDLLAQTTSQYIDIDEDKLIHLIYSDTLYSTSIRDHFLLPTLSVEKFYPTGTKTLMPGSSQTIVEDRALLDFNFEKVDIDEVRLKEGDLSLMASSNIQAEIDLQLSFPTMSKNGPPAVISLRLPANGSGSPQYSQLNLSGYNIDLSGYEAGANLLPVDILATVTTGQENLVLGASDYVEFRLGIARLDFNLITGNFGQLEVKLPQEEVAVEFFEAISGKANFKFKNPMVRFDFLNSIGASVQIKKEILQGRKETGETLSITTDPEDLFNISSPAQPGETTLTSIAITNVSDLISFGPAFMDYKLTARLNADQPQNVVNFVTDSSRTGIVLHADIPLWGSLDGFHLSDTLKMAIQTEDAQVQEASIRTVITNQFPLGTEVQVYFTNLQYDVIDSLFTDGAFKMNPAKVTAEGDLQAAEVSQQDIEVTNAHFERILKADHMIVKALLYTTRNADGTQPHVKIKSNYTLNVNLGLKTSMNISVKQ